jgi:hypothetical protein
MTNKLLFLIVPSLLLIIASCKKEINKIYYEGGTPPNLTASTSNVVLEPGLEANTAITFNWTNPDYMFTTGISSQDVTYTLEMDTLGANFGSSIKYTTVVSKDLSLTYTVGQLNSILGNSMLLQLSPRRNYTLQVRVIASIGSAVKLISNAVAFITKPFAPPPKVVPPDAGTLWITGDAVGSGWANPLGSPYDVSQQFTQVSSTLYQLTVHMVGGGGYKLIQQEGNWDTQYHALTGGTWSGGDFEKKNADPTFPGAPSAGNYKITVDFQLGKYTVTPQ